MALDLSLDPHQPLFGVVGAMSRLREVGFEATELTLDFGEVLVRLGLGASHALVCFDLDPLDTRIGLSLLPVGALLGLRKLVLQAAD